MNERVKRLREETLNAINTLSSERGVLITEFYKSIENVNLSVPVQRAMAFDYILTNKKIYIGEGELIVGERGPKPKATPTYPEICVHTQEDLEVLDTRKNVSFKVDKQTRKDFRDIITPYWTGKNNRERIMQAMSPEWKQAFEAGIFTEFMEQRAPGHTVLDDKVYRKGMNAFRREIAAALAALDFERDPEAVDRREQLKAMDVACESLVLFAERHAALAEERAATETDEARRAELRKIADVCRRVPAEAPRDFHEALQMYWFCHLGVITELNGWDAFSPGHLDQHLLPFYRKGLADGTLAEESARELLECLFVKFNNHTSPPKVGVTAAESGTYTDFANINLGGLTRDGADGSNAVTHLLLDVIDDFHLLQPSSNMQVSRKTPDAVLKHALRVIRNGYEIGRAHV